MGFGVLRLRATVIYGATMGLAQVYGPHKFRTLLGVIGGYITDCESVLALRNYQLWGAVHICGGEGRAWQPYDSIMNE